MKRFRYRMPVLMGFSLAWLAVSAHTVLGQSVCPGHGISPDRSLEVGMPIEVTVRIDDRELKPTADLGIRCVGDRLIFRVSASDPDKDVCAPEYPVMAYIEPESNLWLEVYAQATKLVRLPLYLTVKPPTQAPEWLNTWTIPEKIQPEGSGGEILLVGQTLVFEFVGVIDDKLCKDTPKHEPSANDTPVDLSKYKAIAEVPYIDVDIDSDNNNGTSAPSRSDEEDKIEENVGAGQYGKFIMVNQNDDDKDGRPDYADLDNPAEGQFVPLVVELRPVTLDWGNLKLVFDYPGTGFPTTNEWAGLDIGNGFRDYRTAKKGNLRVWKVDSPTLARGAGNFVSNGVEYVAAQLGFSAFSNVRTFYLEGINEIEKTFVKVSLVSGCGCRPSDKVAVTVVGPNIGVNGNDDLDSSDGLRVGIPDVQFVIDEEDDVIEDQRYGCFWWWSRDAGAKISDRGIVDVAPMTPTVPQSFVDAGFKFYLQTDKATLYVYPGVSPQANRLEYLQRVKTANEQMKQAGAEITPGHPKAVKAKVGLNEFVFKGNGTGSNACVVSVLVEEKGTKNRVVADSVKLTFNDSSNYWSYASTRSTEREAFNYPTEDGRQVQIQRYPDAKLVLDHRDTEKKKHLVFVHGYNVSLPEAIERFDEVWKRVFWLGFRGNFVGLTWEGDEGGLAGFDADVENAPQTSVSMMNFLTTVRTWAKKDPGNVDVTAHSLGNLVAYDGVRLHELAHPGEGLVRNLLGFETAMWREVFETREELEYKQGQIRYRAKKEEDEIGYSVSQQQQHTWRFWFNQPNHDLDSVLAGGLFHSYVHYDYALYGGMRYNDRDKRTNQYDRVLLEHQPIVYRSLIGTNNLPYLIPALLDNRGKNFKWYDLNLPAGCVPNPLTDPNGNLDATGAGWGTTAHSDYFDKWYPGIYQWFDRFFGSIGGNQVPRISLGEE